MKRQILFYQSLLFLIVVGILTFIVSIKIALSTSEQVVSLIPLLDGILILASTTLSTYITLIILKESTVTLDVSVQKYLILILAIIFGLHNLLIANTLLILFLIYEQNKKTVAKNL